MYNVEQLTLFSIKLIKIWIEFSFVLNLEKVHLTLR